MIMSNKALKDVRDYYHPPKEGSNATCDICAQSIQVGNWDEMVDHLNSKHGIKATAEGLKSYIDTVNKERKELTPKTGYNVVRFDDFSSPGEKLELVHHFDTREEAEKLAKKIDNKEFPVYVYGSEDE